MSIAKGERPFDSVLLVLLGISIAINFWQATRQVQASAAGPSPTSPPQVTVGSSVPHLAGITPEGLRTSINPTAGAGSLVLYVYSPECIWCGRNHENIQALAAKRRAGFRLVGVCLSNSPRDCQPAAAGFDATIVPSPEVRMAYKLGPTPQTIVLSRDSRVERVWTGAYSPKIAQEIEAYFGVSLPGVAPTPAPDVNPS